MHRVLVEMHHQSARTGEWNHMGRRQEIKQFILGNFLFTDDDSAFTDDTSLIQQGIVDSTGILELIVFIEETWRSEEHTSELQSLMRISYAVFCLKKKNKYTATTHHPDIYHSTIQT